MEIAPFGVNVPVGVTDGVKVWVGDGPKVEVWVGVGTVPVTVAVGLGVILLVGPKFAFFNIRGKCGLNASCSIIWAEEPTTGIITIPKTSKATRMITDNLAAVLNLILHARSLFICQCYHLTYFKARLINIITPHMSKALIAM